MLIAKTVSVSRATVGEYGKQGDFQPHLTGNVGHAPLQMNAIFRSALPASGISVRSNSQSLLLIDAPWSITNTKPQE